MLKFIVSAALVVPAFVGCVKSSNSTTASSESTPAPVEQAQQEAASTPTPPEQAKTNCTVSADYKDATLTGGISARLKGEVLVPGDTPATPNTIRFHQVSDSGEFVKDGLNGQMATDNMRLDLTNGTSIGCSK